MTLSKTKRKVCVVITARPSYSRIKTALTAIQNHPELELQLVVAASALLERYGSAVKVIVRDGFDITAKVYTVLEGENITAAAKTTGIGIIEISTVFDNIKPDVVLTIADRFETISTAIAATYMNIPLVHVQGGEVTGNIDEKVRHSITKLADAHFVASPSAMDRVIRMGEEKAKVFITGCPSIDLAQEIANDPGLGFNPFTKYNGVGHQFDFPTPYMVVMQHPVTTEYELARQQIEKTLAAVEALDIPTFWFWPNVDAGSDGTSKGIRIFREQNRGPKMYFFKNMEPNDFLKLLRNSVCLVGNSSVGIRECSFLGVPVVNIGSRQGGRDRGKNVIDVDYDKDEIIRAVRKHLDHGHYSSDPVYGDGNAGVKMAELLASMPLSIEKKLTY
jgi:UDP-hydrolysing UDP-N-acetyl-D-glucosamine 2-epimerase